MTLTIARLWAALALVASLSQAAWGQSSFNPDNLPVAQINAGVYLIRAEVAATPASRQKGLMFRERMGDNDGMLFVFEASAVQCFWMRNTKLPLTIAFVADDGSIVNLADMQPMTENSHCSARPVRFALEMNQGWFTKRGIKAGMKLGGGPWANR